MAVSAIPMTRPQTAGQAGGGKPRLGRWPKWVIVGGLAAVLYVPGGVQWQRLTMRRGQLDQDLARITQEMQHLTVERHQLLTNPQYVEAVARRQMRATRQGETVLKLEPQIVRPAQPRRTSR